MHDRAESPQGWRPLRARPRWVRWLALALSYGLLFGGIWAMVKGGLVLRVVGLVAFAASLPLTARVGMALVGECPRANDRRYFREFMPAMVAYIVLMLYVWPLQRTLPIGWPKVCVAVLPVLPIVLFIIALVRHVLGSDELQRRQHLEALAIGAALVSAVTMLLGFLAAAGIIQVDGGLALLLVYPALCVAQGVARCWLTWRSRAE